MIGRENKGHSGTRHLRCQAWSRALYSSALQDHCRRRRTKMEPIEDAAGPGHPAPDAPVENARGESVRLSELWRDSPVIIVFLRHLG